MRLFRRSVLRARRRFAGFVAVFVTLGSVVAPAAAAHTVDGWDREAIHLGSADGNGSTDVATWQQALGLAPDGIFGPATQEATRAWQRDHGLLDHGWVGPVTWDAMFAPATPPELVFVEGAGWGHGVGMSQYGAKGMADEGRTADEILAYYYDGAAPTDLAAAVPGTFLADDPYPLWVNLLDSVDEVAFEAKDGAVQLCQGFVGLLREGDTGTAVQRLEQELADRGYFTGTPDQTFDADTTAAVKAFQTDAGLTVDGIVGSQTGGALWPDEPGECYLQTEVAADGILHTLTVVGDGTCSFDIASEAAGCVASVHGLAPTSRIALFGRIYGSGLQEFASGVLRIRPAGGTSAVHAVLQTDVDSYIAGINEVPASWPVEALRAQAIAARSYAVASAKNLGPESGFSDERRADCWCHLYSSAVSQVFAGYTRELDPNWGPAAHSTDGQVLVHPDAGLVQAFYSSSSGGHTENNDEVWSPTPIAYLRSVDDPWVIDPAINWAAVWTRTFTPDDIAATYGLDTLTSIRVAARNTSGSVATVEIVGTAGGDTVTLLKTGGTVSSDLGLLSRYFNVSWPDPAATPTGGTAGVTVFTDIAGSVHAADIETIAALGITKGCNPPTNDRFCPDDPVTRGQMAAFLHRALDGLVPVGAAVGFVDDDGSTFEADIEWLGATGITKGCNPPTNDRFCPDDVVSRAQMASFLARALAALSS